MLKTRHILISLITLGLFTLVFFGPVLSAVSVSASESVTDTTEVEDPEDGDDDGVDDDFEESNSREVHVEAQEHQIQIESTLKNGENQNKLEVQIQAESEGLDIQAQFKSEAANTEAELSFKVQFYKLIEFVDTDSNGLFDPSVDTFIKEKKLDSFNPAEYSTKTTDTGSIIHYLKLETTDGVFTAHIFLAEKFEVINASTITPNELKIDIEIIDFPYGDSGSQLALHTKLETEAEYEHEEDTEDEIEGYADDEEGLKTTVNGVTGIFSWAKTALVDDIEKNITVSSLSTDDDEPAKDKIYINYPRGQHIYHDPKIGIAGLLGEPNTAKPAIPGYAPILIVGLSVLAALLIARKLRRHA